MRKNRLKTHTTIKFRTKNNYLDLCINVLKNNILNNFIKVKDSLRDLSIFNDQCL